MLKQENQIVPYQTSDIPQGKWLVFSPHADDESFGMGGTLLLAKRQQIPISLVVMTHGELGGMSDDIVLERKLEVQKAVDFLALQNWTILNEKDRGLSPHKECVESVKQIILEENPKHIFIPSAMELHPDHRATLAIIDQALKQLNLSISIYCYEISVQSPINCLIDTSMAIEEKKQLMALYASQIRQNNYQDVVMALDKARTYTLAVNVSHAEGFLQIDYHPQQTVFADYYQKLQTFWQTEEQAQIPLVSIIIRTKDRPEKLNRAINSVLEQMYPRIELVVINDAGENPSLDKQKIEQKLSGFRLVNLKKNLGRAGAANRGMKQANGDYLCFLDDDDTIEPEHIAQLMQLLLKENKKVAYSGVKTDKDTIFNQPFDKYCLFMGNYIPIHAVIFSKEFVEKGCSFDSNLTIYEDWDFWLQLASLEEFIHLDKISASYNFGGDSGAGNSSNAQMDQQYRIALYEKWQHKWQAEDLNQFFRHLYQKLSEQDIQITHQQQLISEQQNNLQLKDQNIANLDKKIQHIELRSQQQKEDYEQRIQEYAASMHNAISIIDGLQLHSRELSIQLEVANNRSMLSLLFQPIKRSIMAVLRKYPRFHFIIRAREFYRTHPGAIKRAFVMLKEKGLLASWQHLKQILFLIKPEQGDEVVKESKDVHQKDEPREPIQGHKQQPARIKQFADYDYQAPEFTSAHKLTMHEFEYLPLISIIMPVYNVDPKWLQLAVNSLERQWYPHWELCIVDDASTNQPTLDFLKQLSGSKIKVHFAKENKNISLASNDAFALTSGEYIALMDNDDELTDDALYEVVKEINRSQADFIYSDEDKVEENGSFCEPHFKPDYSPDFLLSNNYICHLSVLKTELMKELGGFTAGLEGAQDYDLFLRASETAQHIAHIPKVLYHWRKIHGSTASNFGSKSYAQNAGKKAVQAALKRRKIKAIVEDAELTATYRIKREIIGEPLVSIIIPFKDKPELLDLCLKSIVNLSTYKNYEIIAVSNNSQEKQTYQAIQQLSRLDSRIKMVEYNIPFNYSKINNHAVEKYARGEFIVLLNNDIEIISPHWIEELLSFAQCKEVGAVGAKLYYPDDRIQHGGVIIGLGGVADHAHKFFKRDEPGYFGRLKLIQNYSAVTAACLMIAKDKYTEIGGLNEIDLAVAFNDVDFCLRLREKGYWNIFSPYCEAYHHESISRGVEDTEEKKQRFISEIEYMKANHNTDIKADPFYNINLSYHTNDFSLADMNS